MNHEIKRNGVFSFVGTWPDEVLEAIAPLLNQQYWLVPPWCREVVVIWDAVDTTIANCRIDFIHRIATLSFGAGFLHSDAKERRRLVIHELLHISTMPLTCDVEDLIRDQTEEGTVRDLLLVRVEEREEWIIADLSHAIADLMEPRFVPASDLQSKVEKL